MTRALVAKTVLCRQRMVALEKARAKHGKLTPSQERSLEKTRALFGEYNTSNTTDMKEIIRFGLECKQTHSLGLMTSLRASMSVMIDRRHLELVELDDGRKVGPLMANYLKNSNANKLM